MKKYALVVGVSHYQDPDITDLSFAARDAEEVGSMLREVCDFDAVLSLTSEGGREPDHVGIVDALHELAPLLSPEDLFLFYFAGHGIETARGAYLLTSNSRIRTPELASVSTEILKDCLSRIECTDRVLILDACRNDPRKGMGDQDNLLTVGFSRDIMAVAETKVEGVIPATCVLFSCRPGERAYEWPAKGHGAFSHYLLEGLRGAAAVPEGRITVQSLGRYVEAHVPRWSKKHGTPLPQTPWGEQKGSWREIILSSQRSPAAAPGGQSEAPPAPEVRPANVRQEKETPAPRPGDVFWWVLLEGREHGPLTEAKVRERIRDGIVSPTTECWREGMAAWQAMGQVERWCEVFPKRPPRRLPSTLEFDCGQGVVLKLALIRAGEFMMGSGDDDPEAFGNEKPRHCVRITRPFYMGIYPVTQAQYLAVMGKSPSLFKGDSNPVEMVSWDDAQQFCEHLSSRIGRQVRLPTEAEWEYACRAGTTASRYGNLNAIGWFDGNSGGTTHPVGAKRANAWGLHDTIGNVWEWCEDNWHGDYNGAPLDGSAWAGNKAARVVRGGSWSYIPRYCRSSYRSRFGPGICIYAIGFRVVVDLE
ncbi:MAG: SUMF1/EgtB/PvdO family nonheme iron enzyme [Phycisphaeraceae bacterium]|nr:SUMF1/EgtB/PvdO family nonheme iron enzyme [Phycisphaeraceae bacterium]